MGSNKYAILHIPTGKFVYLPRTEMYFLHNAEHKYRILNDPEYYVWKDRMALILDSPDFAYYYSSMSGIESSSKPILFKNNKKYCELLIQSKYFKLMMLPDVMSNRRFDFDLEDDKVETLWKPFEKDFEIVKVKK